MFKKVVVVLGLILAILIVLFFNWKKFSEHFPLRNPGIIVRSVEITYDTIHYYDTIPVPVPVSEQPIPKDSFIDTTKVIDDYFTEKKYSFISADSLFSSNISFTVKKNSLFDYSELFSVVSKTITETKDIYHYPALIIGIGGEFGYSRVYNAPTLELGAILTLNKSSFKFGYEFLHQEVKAGYFYNFYYIKQNGKLKLLKELE
jgi:hypothetical protein